MCAIAGAFNVSNASLVVRHMLLAMQHRGQDGAGIISRDNGRITESVRGFGLVDEVFGRGDLPRQLPGRSAIGHVRYPTSGDPRSEVNLQPFVARRGMGDFALVHNGNLTNVTLRRAELEGSGAILRSDSDTELILHFLARCSATGTIEQLQSACAKLEGAYSMLIMAGDGVFAVVDPWGFRPLVMARMGDGYLFASETCAFDLFENARDYESVRPGTIVELTSFEPRCHTYMHSPFERRCSFEHIYFARPDSAIFGVSVHAVRERLGTILGRRNTVRVDFVTAVPDSSNAAALAFAQASGIPFRFALLRNHYTGRTFITPNQPASELGVRMKLNAVRVVVAGASVLIVDDSIVRGTTARKLAQLLRKAGAREVHMAVASPPVIHPCHWGINTPERAELIAARIDKTALASELGLDSLTYLTHEELLEAIGDREQRHHCTTCFTGEKPIACQTLPSPSTHT